MKNPAKVLVVGFGNIGYRHFQGLLNSNIPLQIDIVEPNIAHHERGLIEPQNGPHKIKVNAYTSIDQIASRYDLVILATCADVRFDIIKALLAKTDFSFAVIEKVAFQAIGHYEECMTLFKQRNIKSWVNYSRRLNSSIKEIKQKLLHNNPTGFLKGVRSGADWGFACNTIHDLELFQYFTNSKMTEFYPISDAELVPSKRKDFYEIRVAFRAVFDNKSEFEIESFAGTAPSYLSLSTKEEAYILFEAKRKYYDMQNGTVHDLVLDFQSKMTNFYAEQILSEQAFDLPTLEDSYQLNKLYLKALTELFEKKLGRKLDVCPIT